MRLTILLTLIGLCAFLCSCTAGGDDGALEVAAPASAPRGSFDHTHAAWTALLKRHARPNGMDYAGLAKERAAFDGYLAMLQGVGKTELASWSRKQRLAFWINVYNAYTTRLIVENPSVGSIKDLGTKPFGSVFDRNIIPLRALNPSGANRNLSLNDVEHKILRARFADARVHAAVNCASASCPPLLDEAFTADRLDTQLDRVIRRFVNDPSRNRLDRAAKTISLSKIFDWFGEDFTRDGGSVQGFVARYADPARAGGDTSWIRSARVRFLAYSWRLNAAR